MKKILVETDITKLLDEANILFEKGWDIIISSDGTLIYIDGPYRMVLIELGIYEKLQKKICHGASLTAVVTEANEFLEKGYDLVDLNNGQYLATLDNVLHRPYAVIIVEKPEDGIV